MNYFCTLFNENYLAKGLAMIESLRATTSSPFQLYVLAMDEATFRYFQEKNWNDVIPVSLAAFENQDLLKVKSSRTAMEYCWTCTPAIIRFCIDRFQLPECTYLDADLYFFNDPQILLDEVKASKKEVLITPHNYTRRFNQTEASGIYCVQFMYFKNTPGGREVLEKWYQQCLEWCYAYVEDGKLGDQKYLDPWLQDFPKAVHSLEHWGAGAPWNIQKFKLVDRNGSIFLKRSAQEQPLVFYHFHGFKKNPDETYFFGTYPYSAEVRDLIYQEYIQHLEQNGIPVDLNRNPISLKIRFKMWVYERFYFLLKY